MSAPTNELGRVLRFNEGDRAQYISPADGHTCRLTVKHPIQYGREFSLFWFCREDEDGMGAGATIVDEDLHPIAQESANAQTK
jgi:hypothetical protein